MYSMFFRQVYLICIIIYSSEDLERTIFSGTKFRFPLSKESILPKVKPNPISFLKNYLSLPLIVMFQVFLCLRLHLFLNPLMHFLNKFILNIDSLRTTLLYANSIWGRNSSLDLWLAFMIALGIVKRDILSTSF